MPKSAVDFSPDILGFMLLLVPNPEWFVSNVAIVGIVLDQIEIGLVFVDL